MSTAPPILRTDGLMEGPRLVALRRSDIFVEPTAAFWVGLCIRLAMCVIFAPVIQETLFLPFMRAAIEHISFDPWGASLSAGGPDNAFPYGVAMYIAQAPFVAIGMALDRLFDVVFFSKIGFQLSLLAADYALLITLRRLFSYQKRLVDWLYWLSPVVIYVTYYHGQTDIIPLAFLSAALLALRYHWAKSAGVFFALAVSAKFSMALAAPFLILFAINNRQFRPKSFVFFATAIVASIFLQLPVFLSDAARDMVFNSPEAGRLFAFSLPLGNGAEIHLFFIGYAAAVYAAFAVGRMNFDLLMALLGVGFLIVLTFAPAAPGWFVWVVPFLVFYQLRDGVRIRAVLLVLAYSLLFVCEQLMSASGASTVIPGLDFSQPLTVGAEGFDRATSMLATLRTLVGVAIGASLFRRGVASNDFFRLSRRPIAIGIAGDSGSGKDTLSEALSGLFSPGSVVSISGDDYHRYERGAPIWQILTHLDPRANDLKAMARDVQSLLAARSISQAHYDHGTGRFTPFRRINGSDIVIVSGLHTFYSVRLREMLDVSIFLDMDDRLRRSLKLHRDVNERGYDRSAVEAAINRRAPDREMFIQPQREKADLILALSGAEDGESGRRPLRLKVRSRDMTDLADLSRCLIGLCGMRVEQYPPELDGVVEFDIEGEIEARDFDLLVKVLAPEAEDLLAAEPRWMDGVSGVMQFIVLLHLIRKTRQRGLKD